MQSKLPASQLHSTVPAGGGGTAPDSPPTFAKDPAHPLTPPPYPPTQEAGKPEAQRLGALDWRQQRQDTRC